MLRRAGQRWQWLLPAAVVFALLAPLLFTDRTFSTDWGNHLWLIWVQGLNIGDLGQPSYFLQSSLGAFYPYYAFYGGSLYALLGVVSELSSPTAAVAFAYAAALTTAYLSWTWLARQAGVRGWRAQLPGCIAVTAPLAVTNLYGRGDIPEVVATAAIPLVGAAALSLVRLPRVRLRDAAAYVAGVVVLTGTHTLTLVWGTAFLLLAALLLIAGNWRAARERVGRGLALAGLGILGAGINGWILAPLVLYHGRLVENEPDPIGLTAYTDPSNLLSLLRNAGNPYPFVTADVNAQLPVLALLWALICGAAYWRFVSRPNKRLALGLLGLGGALLLLVLAPALIDDLPEALRFVQFPYRVLTYVDLCVAGLVTLALAAMQRDRLSSRIPVLALAAIAAFNLALSVSQNFDVRSWLPGREAALASPAQPPPTWYATLQFADGSAPIVAPTLTPALRFPVENGRHDSYEATYPAGPAGTVETNIATGSYFVALSGARAVGRTPAGEMVVGLPASDRLRLVRARASWGAAMTAGRWLSIVSVLFALAAGAYLAARRRALRPE
jgi:hypothetical protein